MKNGQMYVKMYKEVTMESNEYLNFAKEMCSEACKIMKKYFYQDSGISYKGDRIFKSFCRW